MEKGMIFQYVIIGVVFVCIVVFGVESQEWRQDRRLLMLRY